MATQKGRNWSSGDIVTAANLSSIERGVSAVAEEYTPTTWANGDTVTAAGLNNIEQGIANAEGGGSSDFSTAQVTVTAPSGDYHIPNIVDGEHSGLLAWANFPTQGTQNFTIPLYKGVAVVVFNNYTAEGSGNIEWDDELAIITGDCTITISR